MVAQLKPGMSKEQVRFVLGTPLLTDIFHADRWDYVYWRETPGGKREQRKLTVFFEDGKLDAPRRRRGAAAQGSDAVKVAVAGAGGRMGRTLIEAVLADGELDARRGARCCGQPGARPARSAASRSRPTSTPSLAQPTC